MSVYFVYRSQYDTPVLNQVKKFDEATVFDWFKKNWKGVKSEKTREHTQKLLGFIPYGFDSLFDSIHDKKLKAPANADALGELLEEHLYVEGELRFEPHCIQVLTNDDELDVAYYIFDDQFLTENRDKAEFLLQNQFELPCDADTEADARELDIDVELNLPDTAGGGTGHVFFATMSAYCSGGNLSEMESAWVIEGLRLPDLPEYLATKLSGNIEPGTFPPELLLLRSQLLKRGDDMLSSDEEKLAKLREDFSNNLAWQAYFTLQVDPTGAKKLLLENALLECGKFPVHQIDYSFKWNFPSKKVVAISDDEIAAQLSHENSGYAPNNDASKSRVQVDNHFAQISIHTDSWQDQEQELFNRWILFDDLWVSKHPELASSILHYASRWDCLIPEDRDSE